MFSVTGRRRHGYPVMPQFFFDLLFFVWTQRPETAAVKPAVTPSIPGRERRRTAQRDAVIHRIGQRDIAGFPFDALAQRLVCLFFLIAAAALPISNIVCDAAFAPKVLLLQRPIRKQGATVAAKIFQFAGRGRIGC